MHHTVPQTRPWDTDVSTGKPAVSRWRGLLLCGVCAALLASGGALAEQEPARSSADPALARLPLREIRGAEWGPVHNRLSFEKLAPAARGHYDAAQERLASGDVERAAEELDAALGLADGACYELLYLLAHVKQQAGRAGEARVAAERAAACRPDDPDVHYLLGQLAREQGRTSAAIACWRTASAAAGASPDNPRALAAWFELGQALADAGYTQAATEALAEFDRALAAAAPEIRSAAEVAALLADHPYGGLEERVRLLQSLGAGSEAVVVAREGLDRHPDDPRLQRLYVRALLGADRAAAAFDYCRRRLEAAAPGASGAVVGEGLLTLTIEAAQAAGQFDEWVATLRAELSAGRGVDLARRVAERLDRLQQPEQAAPFWRALADSQPAAADPAWALANALQRAGDLPGAVAALVDFYERSAAAADIPRERLDTWLQEGRTAAGWAALLKERTARRDIDAVSQTVLGLAAAAAGQTDLAERLFAAALEQQPDLALAHVAWGRVLLTAYRWEEAKSHAQEALAIAGGLAAGHLLRADAHDGLDENEAAEQSYKAAVDQNPKSIDCLLALARHSRRVGKPLAAQRYLQEVWSLDRRRGDALEELVDSYLATGKLEIARTCLAEGEAADLPPDVLRRLRTTLRFAEAPLGAAHLAELRRQLQESPDDMKTGLMLAAGLFLGDQVDESLAILQRLPESGPEAERSLYLAARVHLQRLEPEQAIAKLEELVRRYPRRENALGLLAEAYLTDFRVAEGRDVLRRMLTLEIPEPQKLGTRRQLLATYVDFMDYDGALALLDEWIAADPKTEEWAVAKSRVLIGAKRPDEAVEFVRQYLTPATERFDELAGRVRTAAEGLRDHAGDAELEARLEALERELNEALVSLWTRREWFVETCVNAECPEVVEPEVQAWRAAHPTISSVKEWTVATLLAAKKPGEALDLLAGMSPTDATGQLKVLLWQVEAQVALGRVDEAVATLAELLERPGVKADPLTRGGLREQIVRLLVEHGDIQRALSYCERWLADTDAETEPLSLAEVLSLKRHVFQEAEREDELIETTQRLLELDPHDPGMNNDLGYSWIDRGEHVAQALEMIRRAVAAEPLNAAFLDSLGWAYYKTGDFDRARKYLGRAVRLRAGQDPVVYDHLGDAEHRLGDHAAARQRWEKAVVLAEAASEAQRRTGRYTDLLARLRTKLAAGPEGPAVAPTATEQHREDKP